MNSLVPLSPTPDPEAIKAELTPDRMVCRFKDIEIYVATAFEAPSVMTEVGRIREREYRRVGAGRNLPADIDHFDTEELLPYRQLLAWDPVHREIVAMYRYIFCGDAVAAGGLRALRTAGLFEFSSQFVRETLPATVELGRSVVNQEARRAFLGLYAVWTGLGAIMVEHPEIRFFFGNVSVYRSWPKRAVDLLMAYLTAYHAGPPGQVVAKEGMNPPLTEVPLIRQELFSTCDQQKGYEILRRALGELELTPPPILVSYLRSTTELLVYDAAEDLDFGGALEVAITVPTDRLTPKARRRFVDSYVAENRGILR